MSFYYFRLRVAAFLRPVCLGLSIIACCMVFIPGAIAALDSLIRVESSSPEKFTSIEDVIAAWQEILVEGDISRHHRLAGKKTALWWQLVEYKDIGYIEESLTKKESKAIKRWLNKNKRNLEMQLAFHVWLYNSGENALATKRIKNLARKFPEYDAFGKQYHRWNKKSIPTGKRLDARSQTFLESR